MNLKIPFIVLGLMFLAVICFGQTADKVINTTADGISTVYNDVKSTAPAVSKALNSLAKELKVGANAVWDILVRQQLVWSWCYLLLSISSILSGINVHYRYAYGVKNIGKHDGYDSHKNCWRDGDVGMFCLSLLFFCILFGLSITHFTDMMTGFINPEYSAMQTIIKMAIEIK